MARRSEQSRPSARTSALIAGAARKAVVFRRGPSKQVQMLRWDLVTDEVTPGQWLSGRIYDERCGLSPDGRLLVYFAGKFRGEIPTFTAISRPPYFTALALWPGCGTWGGAGFFEGNRRVILNVVGGGMELHRCSTIPADFEIDFLGGYERRCGAHTPESAQGWTLTARGVAGAPATDSTPAVIAAPWVCEKQNPVHPRWTLERSWLGSYWTIAPSCRCEYRLVERSGAVERSSEPLDRHDWADWDHDGSLLYGADGCLYRRSMNAARAGDRPRAALVADLRGNVYTNVLPTDRAREWP